MIDKSLITRLAEVSEKEWCVTIYLPKEEQDDQYELDQLRLNKALAEAKNHLQAKDMEQEAVEKMLKSARRLLDENPFFNRYQSGAVALFLSPGTLETMDIPILKEEMVYVGGEFYLRPILSLLNEMQHFFLLVLDEDNALLFEGTQNNIAQIGNLVPLVEARVGAPVPDAEKGEGIYLKKLYQRLDGKARELIAEEKAPLMLGGSEQRTQLFREVSQYSNILAETIDYRANIDDHKVLHRRAKPIMEEYLREQRRAKRRFFVKEMLKGNASISLTDVLAAAVGGRVATLFMDKDEFTTGQYKPAIQYAEVDEQPDEDHTALFNLAAINTFLNGGEVYDLERKDMPDSTTSINATFWPE